MKFHVNGFGFFCFMMPVIIPQAVYLLSVCMIVGGFVYSILCSICLSSTISCALIIYYMAAISTFMAEPMIFFTTFGSILIGQLDVVTSVGK